MRHSAFRFVSASALVAFWMVTVMKAQGLPYVPPGQLHSFDQFAGLHCTAPGGGTGSLQILYLRAPIATLACATGRFMDLGKTIFDTQTRIQWEKKTGAD